jgi:hypothetical protein
LGTDKEEALKKYYRLELSLESVFEEPTLPMDITIKELANRFQAAQQQIGEIPIRP